MLLVIKWLQNQYLENHFQKFAAKNIKWDVGAL